MMWFNKNNPNALYVDHRELEETDLCDGRLFAVHPDIIADFRDLPFPAETFSLVVFDHPHLIRINDNAYMAIKFERLTDNWKEVMRDGFKECMRVLKPFGTLVFKWSEVQIPTREVIAAVGQEPLFGHISGRKMNTHWMCFMKLPEGEE